MGGGEPPIGCQAFWQNPLAAATAMKGHFRTFHVKRARTAKFTGCYWIPTLPSLRRLNLNPQSVAVLRRDLPQKKGRPDSRPLLIDSLDCYFYFASGSLAKSTFCSGTPPTFFRPSVQVTYPKPLPDESAAFKAVL